MERIKEVKLQEVPKDSMVYDPKKPVRGFIMVTDDGIESLVPNDPENRHYQEIAMWYDKQKSKPFKYKFKKLL